jgi:(p)ppGpp synthase/HD superfamily hydrolase
MTPALAYASTMSLDCLSLNEAIRFSAAVHADETRADGRPYIVHPLAVVGRLTDAGHTDIALLKLAVLHDVLESDPECEPAISSQFGGEVVEGLRHLTVDRTLNVAARKATQLDAVIKAPAMVRLIKLADRLDNIDDISVATPVGWSAEKKRRYLDQTLCMMPAFLDLASPLVGRLIASLGGNPLLTDAQRERLARAISR